MNKMIKRSIYIALPALLAAVWMPGANAQSPVVIEQWVPQSVVIPNEPSYVVPNEPSYMVTRTVTNYVLMGPTIGSMSDYHSRLANIGSQIQLGVRNGWLNNDVATLLRSEENALMLRADDLMSRGIAKDAATDSLERQINLLNQEVTNSMQETQDKPDSRPDV